eukprot:3241275-Pleurochrysis_carterae.AAC.1
MHAQRLFGALHHPTQSLCITESLLELLCEPQTDSGDHVRAPAQAKSSRGASSTEARTTLYELPQHNRMPTEDARPPPFAPGSACCFSELTSDHVANVSSSIALLAPSKR